MTTFKLRKGLDIHLEGKAEHTKVVAPRCETYALCPGSFPGLTPKVLVKEGDRVKAGTPLFADKACPEVTFASPVSGVVEAVVRGERRRLLAVTVKADQHDDYEQFGAANPAAMSAGEVKAKLLQAGLFGYINQRPYDVTARPADTPKGIFVSALRDKPLAADFLFEYADSDEEFQAGLTALSRIAPTHLGIGTEQTALQAMADVDVNVFDGPCPAGNVGVQINHIDPVNKGEVVWTVDPTAVIFFGRLFLTGRVDLRRLVAVCGSNIDKPVYMEALVGTPLSAMLKGHIDTAKHNRIINGNVLTGSKDSLDGYLGAHSSELTVIPEGDDNDETLGWIMPRLKDFSVSRSYFSWLMPKRKEYNLDARVKGGERHMIMSGEYDRVLPMDIYPEYLIKAIIAGDIDRMEQLGIYEVAPEDFALCEFVDSSKLELQRLVSEALLMLRKENA